VPSFFHGTEWYFRIFGVSAGTMMSRATAVGEPTLVAGERGVVIVVTKGCDDDESTEPKSRIGKPIPMMWDFKIPDAAQRKR
jgi:hypothetical protein